MVVWSLQALAEKGVSYNYKYTDLFTGQSLSPDYLAVNPKGTVPALVVQGPDGRQVIPDSRCVTAWLTLHCS
jgi:glutathione S-transferase/GST-like protein